jgi:hypothetical protein
MGSKPITQAPKEFVDVVLKKIKITRETARENLQRTQESMKEKHDQSAHDSTFNGQIKLKRVIRIC